MVAVARKSDAPIARVARDFGIAESCLARWLRIADRDDGVTLTGSAPVGSTEAAELRDLQRRNKRLEQENEILRRATAYFARDVLPQ